MSFSSYDTFKIEKNNSFKNLDIYSLTNLYLPLVGVDGFSLYFLFFELQENQEYPFGKLMDHLNFSNSKFLEQAISKLEGIGLLKTYFHKQNGYLFTIQSPLTFEGFMSNQILVKFLESKIGNTEIKKMIKESQDKKGYKDITKSFDEVFERTSVSIKSSLPECFKEIAKDSIYIKNEKFDYTYFKLQFDSKLVRKEFLDIKEFEEEILKISYHYNLNEEEMYDAVMRTIQIDKDLKIEDIKKHALKIYEAKGNKPIKFKTKEAVSLNESELDDETARFIDLAEKMSCEELLYTISGIKPSVSELKLFDELSRNTGFTQGIINIMILYVTKEKNGEIPSYNYFEKIANTWKRAKVKTSKDALDLINKKKEDPKGTKVIKGYKNVKEAPEWYQDYENKIKEASNVTVSEEEQAKALEEVLASGLFNEVKED